MARTLSFVIEGEIDTTIFVEEGDFDGDGFTDLRFTATVDESGGTTADLRGLFWHVVDDAVGGWSVWPGGSADITDEQFNANAVSDLGNGANMNGRITNKGRKFDAGVEIGTQGRGRDDIQSTTFVVTGDGEDLTLDDIGGMRFGVRLTSYGEISGDRDGSLKIAGIAPHAPDAIDDSLTTDEDNANSINILTNDTDADGDPLTVTSIEGGTVGVQYSFTSDGGRDALVTVNADGSMTVDPNGNFEDLSTGDTDTFTLTYHISDGNGGTDCADIVVTITGVNDKPVANDDSFYVESGDTVLVDAAANDTDVDGTVNAASMLFSGATGTAVESGGQLSYTAPDIGGDTTDDSFNDAFTYTIEDNEGLASDPANATARVIDPLVESETDAATAATNGQNISLSLSTEDRTFNTSSFYDVGIITGGLDQDVNVSFVIDGSASVDFVNPGAYSQQVQAVQNAINDLRSAFSGSVADVDVQLVQFSEAASAATFDLFDAALDDVNTGTPIRPYQDGGATNYESALDAAVAFFSGQAADDNFMLFASDGEPNSGGAYNDEVTELNNLNVSISAVGFGGGVSAATLDAIDNTGGADIVPTAGDLGDVFADTPLFPADLLVFSLKVDGIEVADETDLIDLGGGDYALDGTLLGLDNSLGATNTVTASAEFDTDNDGIADEFRFVDTVINGTDGTDVLFA